MKAVFTSEVLQCRGNYCSIQKVPGNQGAKVLQFRPRYLTQPQRGDIVVRGQARVMHERDGEHPAARQ